MSFLSHYLQPPAYLKLPIFALDISDRSFKYIKFKKAQHGLRLEDHGTQPLPAGLVKSGVITNTETLANILRAHFKNKPYRHVALALPEEKGFVRTIHMPRIATEELREAISLQLEEHIPLPPDQTSFAYHVLPSHTEETMEVLIAAFPTPLLTAYESTIKQAGLSLVSLEIESQAIARSVIPNEEAGSILVVDIGLTRTSFLFAKNGYTQLTSTIPIGGKSMHEAIAKTLNIDEKKAEQLKKDTGLSRTKEGKPVFDALAPLIVTIQNEIKRRIDYWQQEAVKHKKTNHNNGHLNYIYLCGREANLIGLPRYLSHELNTPVSLANVWTNATHDPAYIPEIEFRDSLGYATSIGLALNSQEL